MNLKFWQKPPVVVVSEYERRRQEMERMLALAGNAEHPMWLAMVGLADEAWRNEQVPAIEPNLGNEARQYNAGRAAAAYDFAMALRDIMVKAERGAREAGGVD